MLHKRVLFLIFVAAAAAALNKCCPAGLGLNPKLDTCVPLSISQGLFQNRTLTYRSKAVDSGQINIPCPLKESGALVMNSMDMNFTVEMDSLELVPAKANGLDRLKAEEFCLDQVWAGNETYYWIAITCPCIRGLCVRTCCANGKAIYSPQMGGANTTDQCVDAPSAWQKWSPLNFSEPRAAGYFEFEELPKCSSKNVSLHNIQIEAFNISANGLVTFVHEGEVLESTPLSSSDYCLGITWIRDEKTGEVKITPALLECDSYSHGDDTSRPVIYTILFLVGAVFLLATIVVHMVLPALTKGVRGKGLVAHCSFMFVAHIALIVAQLQGSTLADGPCHFLAYLIQYSLLAGFFWLNVLCIDISMTFRSLQSMVPRGTLSERKQFAWYSVYALAIPFVIFITTLAVNEVYRQSEGRQQLFLPNPNIGDNSCWFGKDSSAILVFFYGPIGIVLLINLALFLFTTYKIYKLSRASSMINQNDNSQRHNAEHKRFVLFLKLFGLMGIPWVFEIISWAVGGDDKYWYFTDAVNILRSIFIFTTFCWKRKVWMLLSEKYPKIKKFALMIRSESDNAQTGSNRSNPSNNESFADTMNAASMETLAMDLPGGAKINQ